MTNYFAHATAAERYARSRPNFHPLVIERLREYLALAVRRLAAAPLFPTAEATFLFGGYIWYLQKTME
jgi:hypothetical protein